MNESNGFDPHEHLTDIRGKPYLPVAWRIAWFRADDAESIGTIYTEVIKLDAEIAVFKATASIGVRTANGHGSCAVERSQMISGRYIEKAETAAVGRALALLGYGTQFAVTDFDEAPEGVDALPSRQVDEAPRRAPATTTTPKGDSGERRMKAKYRGNCSECGQPIEVGDDMVFVLATKQAHHDRACLGSPAQEAPPVAEDGLGGP